MGKHSWALDAEALESVKKNLENCMAIIGINGEAEILQRMRNLRDMVPPVGYQEIADILKSSGVPTRMGKRWKASTIQKILSRKQVGRES